MLIFLFVTFLSFAQSTGAQSAAYDDAEAYAVYSAILQEEWPAKEAKAKRLVIQIETEDYRLSDDKTCLQPAEGEEGKYGPIVSAYREINTKAKLLQRKFTSEIPYDLVAKASIRTYFAKAGVDGWPAFYNKYPDSGGFITMSAVGFNADKTIAIVYMGHSCGGLCGGGLYHFLRKTEGKWSVFQWPGSTCMWVS